MTTQWEQIATYYDHGFYWIDANPERTQLRTAWTEDRADAVVQYLHRAADLDAKIGGAEILWQTETFGIDGDDGVFIDGVAYRLD